MRLPRVVTGGVIAVAAATLAYGLTHWQLFEGTIGQAEARTLDYRMRSAAAPQESDVALLLFDSATVSGWPYEVPFPRPVLADLVEIAADAGASVIGLDVFLERRNTAIDERFGPGDARLRSAIEEAGNVILAAPTEQTDSGRVLVRPHPYFADVAEGIASVDVPTPYETVRDFVLTVRTAGGELLPGFALAAYALGQGLDPDSLLAEAERAGRLSLPGLPDRYASVPDRERAVQTAPLLFTGPPSRTDRDDGAFTAVSAEAVMAFAELPAEFRDPSFLPFQDRVVLLGSGFHAEERFRTPFYDARDGEGAIRGWTYGVEVLGTAIQNLMSGTMPVPLGRGTTFALLAVMAIAVTAMTFWQGVTWGAVLGVVVLAGEVLAAWLLFDDRQLHVPVVGPTLATVFAFIGASSWTSIVEGREKRRIRGAFSKYLAPAVVKELVEDPSRLELGGEKREVTLIFTDLAGFTSLSETMDPDALLTLLNEYLDEMAAIVLEEGGTLDKYIGDAIMAMYGAPTEMPDHALRACRTAVRMQRRLEALNEQWRALDRPELGMRIGINTGVPVVGNIGGEQRFDYTALGDAVNLAARLEPACKTYGVETMISGNTRDAAGDALVTRELELLAVYGKVEPVPVFELLGLVDAPPDEATLELIGHYEAGIAAYRNRDFELAQQYFRAAREIDPEDGPTLLYLDRCEKFLVSPPPADWDAVERRQVK